MTKIAFSLSVAALALASAAAYAAPGDLPAIPRADRTITRAEAQTLAAARFERMDANHDGKLDPADRAAEQTAMFDRIDTDHNGAISRDEFAAIHAGREPMGGHGMGGPGMAREGMAGEGMNHDLMRHGEMRQAAHGERQQRGAKDALGGAGGMARMADTNGDHAVTRDEFTTAAMRRFDMIDSNKDGSVTPAEQQTAMAAMRARMGAMRDAGAPPPPPPPPPSE